MEDLSKYQIKRNILCIDLKSFYASVECVLRGLDPFKTPLVVADKSRGDSTIILAVTPYLKELNIPSRCRIFELPKKLDVIYAKPRMKKYLEYSSLVIETYLEFVSNDDIYVYSVDEAFLDVTNYLNYYKISDYELALKILKRIEEKLGLTATCGIGPNMLVAKLAMDIEAKKIKNNIAKWDYKDIPYKLWDVTPLSKMWSIGHRMERNLNLMGFEKIGDIARTDKEKLKKRFGILGLELWYHTNGIDMSLIKDKDLLRKKPKSFGVSQVLPRDYDATEILSIMIEMIDDVTRRLRVSKKRAKTISFSIGYSRYQGGGFSRQVSLDQATANESVIYQACLDLFDSFYEGYPIKTIGVSLSNFDESNIYHYSIFEDIEVLDKEIIVSSTVDKIKNKYGKNSIIRGTSLEKHATARERNKQIGGHHV
ncbi:Y-family DNA polymerase [Haploplasma modicum]|uniref:Y-family DNA polymerase n=1 Tax=Haploplasma modicum TaxID=2150 RepID=UPI00047E54DE|nr:Y-family DNA polymerase [Haploplasma modicum]